MKQPYVWNSTVLCSVCRKHSSACMKKNWKRFLLLSKQTDYFDCLIDYFDCLIDYFDWSLFRPLYSEGLLMVNLQDHRILLFSVLFYKWGINTHKKNRFYTLSALNRRWVLFSHRNIVLQKNDENECDS